MEITLSVTKARLPMAGIHRAGLFGTVVPVAVLLLIASVIVAPAHAAPDMHDGEWEITTRMEISGMPQMMQPITARQCITRQDIIPGQQQGGPQGDEQQCRVVDQASSGDTVSWRMRCEGEWGNSDIEGSMTYRGERMQGETRTTTTPPNGVPMVVTSHMQGHRIGPCRE